MARLWVFVQSRTVHRVIKEPGASADGPSAASEQAAHEHPSPARRAAMGGVSRQQSAEAVVAVGTR